MTPFDRDRDSSAAIERDFSMLISRGRTSAIGLVDGRPRRCFRFTRPAPD
ncbi:MAG TPA: hypothetical protein VMD75_10740 [Candidatus Binataceae bacterium]|nr:hypothetical protein [Candidatus Binataceae bacterium]